MTENCWILLLIKEPARGKMRLEPHLTASQRIALANAMAQDSMALAIRALPVDHVVVLTDSATVAEQARSYGCRVISDTPNIGLAKNIEDAVESLSDWGAREVMVLGADLPMVTTEDLAAALAVPRGTVMIGRAGRDGGTTVLRVPTGKGYRFFFETSSSARMHAEEAERLNLSHCYLEGPFAQDIDVIDDYHALVQRVFAGQVACGVETRRVLDDQRGCIRIAASSRTDSPLI